jgi:ABC-type siderophore export system fused ATPase/permease subunit
VDRIGAGIAFGSGRSRKTGLQGIEITMGILEPIALFGLLIYAAMIVGAVVVVVSIWRGMMAHERMADSMERMANAAEKIEKFVNRDGEPRA